MQKMTKATKLSKKMMQLFCLGQEEVAIVIIY